MNNWNFFKNDEKQILIFGHRGNPITFPENTISSFSSAIKLGVDIIETDLRLTKDNVIILCHDSLVKRTTNGKGKIRDYTFEELGELDAGYKFSSDNNMSFPFRDKGIQIPALFELFEKFPNVTINVDMKDRNPDFPQLLSDLIRNYDMEQKILVGSFHPKQVRRFRKINPNVSLIASIIDVYRYYLSNKINIKRIINQSNFDIMQVPQQFGFIDLLKSSFIDGLHKLNIPCHVWIVDNTDDLEKMLNLGVDGVFTNNPELCINYLQQKEKDKLLISPKIIE